MGVASPDEGISRVGRREISGSNKEDAMVIEHKVGRSLPEPLT